MVRYGRRNLRAYRPRTYRRARRYRLPPRIRRRRRISSRYSNILARLYKRPRNRFRKIRRRRAILSAKMLARTKGILRWINTYRAFFDTLYGGGNVPEDGVPSDDGLYTTIRVLTRTCWAAARYVYKFRKHFRVFPKLYEINKPQANNAHRLRNELSDVPASLATAKEFYTIVRLMKKPNPRSEDWRNMMNAHQSAGSLAVLVTAAALSSTKLENLMNNLFPNETTKILGLIIISQLLMLRLMTMQYNIVKLTGMINRFPHFNEDVMDLD